MMNTQWRKLNPNEEIDINARLDFEAEHDAKFIQDTELMRRDLNATFNDADRGMPLRGALLNERESSPVSRLCDECREQIHPGILRKVPEARLCYACYGKRNKPIKA